MVLRLMLGINILLHGITRLPDLAGFADGMSKEFADTWMPVAMARAVGFVIPIVETILGLFLLAGFKLRLALLGTGALLCVLHFGMGLQQAWGTLGSQLVYGIVVFLLLITHRFDPIALDRRCEKRATTTT